MNWYLKILFLDGMEMIYFVKSTHIDQVLKCVAYAPYVSNLQALTLAPDGVLVSFICF